ncbi:FUSC family protein [Puerhibacterium puerhi]|uniref:FUSC family protein n=1 Tax=Puerhibacterium puerhi TaxID=2692623 RepID=UPI001358014F|nr:FUSC family protein [Puerhibacterium puerhi]
MRWLDRARRHDRNLAALRRAARGALVMPLALYLGLEVVGDEYLGLFAVFGSFAVLLLADFTGPMPQRLQAQAALGAAGVGLVCLGTLTSAHPWLAALGMLAVGLPILFAGVVSSLLASATPALLLAYVLPACLPASASAIPERIAGWGLAAVLGLLAVGLLWPTPTTDPLREPVARCLRLMAAGLRAEVAFAAGGPGAPSLAQRERAVAASDAAAEQLRTTYLAAPYRPTTLDTVDRTVVRLADEVEWLAQVVQHGRPAATVAHHVAPEASAVVLAAADVLDLAARVLHDPGAGSRDLEARVAVLRTATETLDDHVASALVAGRGDGRARDDADAVTLTALDPTFRSHELAFGARRLATNVVLTSAAWRRTWTDRLLGRQPAGIPSGWAAAVQRGSAHLRLRSVWLQNSVRGAVGLALAVFVADSSGIQHAFWVVLGTLSVLRSNALSTGQQALRSLLGTAVGFGVGGLLVHVIGTDEPVLWAAFPLAVLVAGFLPAAVSFAAGQAAFTVLVMILFNLLQPAGWQVGLVRVEDVALGCGVSLLVGLLFWPRGAGAELRRAIAGAYADSIRYLAAAVGYGMACGERGPAAAPPPATDAAAASAASRRLDDAYRTYLTERGVKPSSLASVTSLVNGVVGVRLVADAVVALWQRDGSTPAPRPAARRDIDDAAHRLVGWYDALARSLVSDRTVPDPLVHAAPPEALVDALRGDLTGEDPGRTATAARLVWTHDYLDAMRRHQRALVEPAREAQQAAAGRDEQRFGWLLPRERGGVESGHGTTPSDGGTG